MNLEATHPIYVESLISGCALWYACFKTFGRNYHYSNNGNHLLRVTGALGDAIRCRCEAQFLEHFMTEFTRLRLTS